MPKISIIVPVYNVEKYLEECIISILNQTFEDFEVILIDDGSTDKSGFICDEYKKKDNRIKVIHKKNGGLSDARNAGLNIANGEYIGFVDSDDYIHPQMYEILYKNIVKNSSDMIICNYQKVLKKEEFNKYYNEIDDFMLYSNIEVLEIFLSEDSGKCISPCNKLYAKKLFNKLRFEEGKIHEDQIISPKLIYNSNKIVMIDKILYFYRCRIGSLSNNGFNEKKLDLVHALWDNMIFFNKINSPLKNKVEQIYVYYLFKYYFKGMQCFGKNNINLINMRKEFLKVFFILIKNYSFSKKERISWILFLISPCLYKRILKKY